MVGVEGYAYDPGIVSGSIKEVAGLPLGGGHDLLFSLEGDESFVSVCACRERGELKSV